MKKNIISIIFFAAFFVLAVTGCNKSYMNITGKWNSTLTLKNDMAAQDDPYAVLASVYVKQTNEFEFNEDGTYSRTVSQKVSRAESFDERFSPEYFMEMYKNSDSNALIKGTYSLSGSVLKLHTETIVFNEQPEMTYEKFYESTQAMGPVDLKTRLSVNESGELVIQGIKFRKAE